MSHNLVTDTGVDRFALNKEYIGLWLDKNNFTDQQLTFFLNFAELELNRSMRIFPMETIQFVTTQSGSPYLAYPDSYLGFRWARIDETGSTVMKYVTPEVLMSTDRYMRAGRPRVYTLMGDRVRLGPIPDSEYTVESAVYEVIPLLGPTVLSNWWAVNAPELLLYGALLQSAPFLMDDERVATWQTMYDRAMKTTLEYAEQFQYPSGSLVQTRI